MELLQEVEVSLWSNVDGKGPDWEPVNPAEIATYFRGFGDANVPVNIKIREAQTDATIRPYWLLIADNYMPRRESVTQEYYRYRSTNLLALRQFVKEFFLPLYLAAFQNVANITVGLCDEQYYWKAFTAYDN